MMMNKGSLDLYSMRQGVSVNTLYGVGKIIVLAVECGSFMAIIETEIYLMMSI